VIPPLYIIGGSAGTWSKLPLIHKFIIMGIYNPVYRININNKEREGRNTREPICS
jgi:hypothetical protein